MMFGCRLVKMVGYFIFSGNDYWFMNMVVGIVEFGNYSFGVDCKMFNLDVFFQIILGNGIDQC